MLGIREGAGITIFCQNSFVSQYRKTSQGNHCVLHKISSIEKIYGYEGEEQGFLWKIFHLTVPKKFVGEPFRVSLISGIEKFYASEGYVTIFCRNFFVSVPKNLLGQPFRVALISGIEKFYASEDYVTIFCRNFLSHNAEKFRRGTF